MIELIMPRFGMSMTEGHLTEWLVPDGSRVDEGQMIYTVETDKSAQDVEAPSSGVLRQFAVAGNVYPVGEKLAEIV